MINVDEAVIARLKKNEKVFEILVDSEKALEFKNEGKGEIRDILAVPEIYKDAKKGMIAADLEEIFGTENVYDIAEMIIQKGDVQMSQEYRNKITEEKRRRIISKISMYAIDTRTNKPVPEKRLELAIEQIGFNVDPFKNVEEQVKELLEQLQPVLPIKTEEITLQIVFPSAFAGKAYGIVTKTGTIKKDMWLSNGSWLCDVQIPAGLQDEFINQINKFTQGKADIRYKDEIK